MRELSLKEKKRKCAKCGSSSAEDSTVTLHRFPQPNKANKSRCELWAKFCFPNDAWWSPQFQNKLFTEHKMLCDKHFKSASFEKEKPAKFSKPVNHFDKESSPHSKEQDGSAEPEVVVVKNEPHKEIDIETRSQSLKRNSLQTVKKDYPKNTKQRKQIIESAEIEGPLMKTKDITWDVEAQEITQEEVDEWFGKTSKCKRNDDCELYGKLMTKKLRTYAVYERSLLMFKIDGLLIEHPPGFDTSSHNYSNISTDQIKSVSSKKPISKTSTDKIKTIRSKKTISKAKSSRRKYYKSSSSSSSESAVELHSYTINTDNTLSSPSQPKRRKVTKVSSQSVQLSRPIEETSHELDITQVTSTSMQSLLPVNTMNILNKHVKVTSTTQKQPISVTSSIPDQPVNVKSSNQRLLVKVISNIQYPPIKVTSSIPNQPKVTRSICLRPDQSIKVTGISNKLVAPQASSNSLPSHLPLQITIPQTKVVPVTRSKFVTSSLHPKGKIVIVKSKSSKYVPSKQPPILITVPSYSSLSTKCDMNSLEQLSSIAATHASQSEQFQMSYDSEENVTTDDINVVLHEVVLSASEQSPSQNIVETALKIANIKDAE